MIQKDRWNIFLRGKMRLGDLFDNVEYKAIEFWKYNLNLTCSSLLTFMEA